MARQGLVTSVTVMPVRCLLPAGRYPKAAKVTSGGGQIGCGHAAAGSRLAGRASLALAQPRATLASAAGTARLSDPGLWLTGAERSLLLAGLSVALGGLAGRGLARQYRQPGPAPLPPPWALRGCVLGLLASAALLITARADLGLAARLAQPPVAGLESGATAVIAAIELACFAAAAVLLRLRQAGWSVLPLLGVVTAEAVRAHPEGIVPVAGALLSFCHVLPAVLWAGMLAYVLRAAVAWRADPPAMQGLVRLYGNAAAWLLAAIVLTGVLSALLLVPLGSLLTTAYGRFLIAKAALVGLAICLAVAGRMWLRSHPVPGAGPALVTRLELAALAAALAVTGILTVLAPPARPAAPAAQQASPCQRPAGPAGHPARPAGAAPSPGSCRAP
jgi:copper transport protein